MSLWPSLNWTAGRIGHVFLTAYNPTSNAVIRARSTSGVVETALGGSYFLPGGMSTTEAFTVWDDDGAVIGGEMLVAPTVVGAAIATTNGTTGPGAVFVIKRGDSAPSFFYQCTRGGAPVDLSGSSVLFKMRTQPGSGTLLVNRPAVTVDAVNGLVRYDWQTSGTDTATAGEFDAEFEVSFPNSTRETFPTTDPDTDAADEYIRIKIPQDLD